MSDEASVAGLFAAAGRCDIVIANAGQADSALMARTTLPRLHGILSVNPWNQRVLRSAA